MNFINLFHNPPKDYGTLFLDMNSFFASVEQQVRPELRGKPVGVAPYTGNSGCIIAASSEAKALGIKTGTKVGEAKSIYPKVAILESRPALYMIYHKEIKKVVESFTPFYQPLSIDEFLLRLTPREQNKKSSAVLALSIKAKMAKDVGDYLRCSIGIGPNYFLSKVAGESKKPDGMTVLELDELESFYSCLQLIDLPGINWRMEKFLKAKGVFTPLSLYHMTLSELRQILNHPGRLWYFRLRGYEVDRFEAKGKTIGHSHVLSPDLRTKQGALSVLDKLIYKAGYRLRQCGCWASGVSVAIGFTDHNNFHQSKRVDPFCDNNSFRQHVEFLLRKCLWNDFDSPDQLGFRERQPIFVSVSAFGLVRMRGEQISLFSEIHKSRQISHVLDEIDNKFGPGVAYPASMFYGRDSAPDRIPFGRPRYDIIH
ncbi:MAG: hypothetical protein WCT32_04060 [Patescibacteria group bacterium]|jgi:DNA polymerase-4